MNHTFSIEMKSKKDVSSLSLSNGSHEGVLFSGNLGNQIVLNFIEKSVLMIEGNLGVIRIDLNEVELLHFFKEETKK